MRVDQQPPDMLPFVPDRLMNSGEIGGFGRGDVVEATHGHVGWDAEPAAGQRLQCAERQHVTQADNRCRKSLMVE